MDTNPAFTVLSDVEQQPVQWFWTPRIALGELTLIEGDPATNKSGVVLNIAARMTIGAGFPDGEKGAKGGVVLLAEEDSVPKRLIARLRESSADLSRIAIPNRALTLPTTSPTSRNWCGRWRRSWW